LISCDTDQLLGISSALPVGFSYLGQGVFY